MSTIFLMAFPSSKGKPVSRIIVDAVSEVRAPLILATFTVIAAIAPMIESLALRDLPGRVAGFLLHEADRPPAGRQVHLTISQRELAKIVGATPEALSRALRRLEQTGLLTARGRDVKILDREGLAREAGIPPDGD